ncbi:MAG: hypothetical protein JWO80_2349 [Bryobacterales bacterium]|nr:hypothetical protein [Bryobacterales bacterium]
MRFGVNGHEKPGSYRHIPHIPRRAYPDRGEAGPAVEGALWNTERSGVTTARPTTCFTGVIRARTAFQSAITVQAPTAQGPQLPPGRDPNIRRQPSVH